MEKLSVRIKYLSPLLENDIPKPAYATEGAAGLDCCACMKDAHFLLPGERFAVPLGISMEIPVGFAGFLYGRSGLGMKHGITLPNCVGVIDSDYRGEIKCAITNYSDQPYNILPGERICQLVIAPVQSVELIRVDKLDETTRGTGGFGSTGRK